MTDAPLLEMHGIVKTFPGVRALDGVDLEVRAGEVHCLLGQNGAGKSTLIKVLSGAHHPDEGEIRWKGDPVTMPSPVAAVRLGVATMYQELDLVDGLTVADNVFLGHERVNAGFVRRRVMERRAEELLERMGHGEVSPRQEVGTLSAAKKQIVSMARALSHEAELIVMDEPSAVLANEEVENLFRVIGDLTADQVAILYISHRLEEIRRIGDRVTVLKDGRAVAVGIEAHDTPTQRIVSLMTGRTIEYPFPDRPPPREAAPVLLEVEGLTRPGEFTDVSLAVHAGEIVGLAGLVGSGRSEILETIYGARRSTRGSVTLDGKRLPPGNVNAAVKAGMALAPEERKSQALLLQRSVRENVTLPALQRYSRLGFIDRAQEKADAGEQTRALDLRPPDPERPARTLSGGNQQKAVLGRWLLTGSRLLLLDEPTRGVDVGARSELYGLVRKLANSGEGILMVSSEIPEVLGLADRVLVIREGRVVADARAGELTEADVLDLVMEGARA